MQKAKVVWRKLGRRLAWAFLIFPRLIWRLGKDTCRFAARFWRREYRERTIRARHFQDHGIVMWFLTESVPSSDREWIEGFLYSINAAYEHEWRTETWLAIRVQQVLEQQVGIKLTVAEAREAIKKRKLFDLIDNQTT